MRIALVAIFPHKIYNTNMSEENTKTQPNERAKKMIAPIVITVVMVTYYVFYFALIVRLVPHLPLKLFLGIIPAALSAAMIYVCVQRINEIRRGEEDDISKY